MTKKNLLIAIVAIIGMTMFFACSQGNKEGTGNIQPPVKIQAYGKSYTIENYEIEKTESGTMVKATGKGCGIDNASEIPIKCNFIFCGLEFSPMFTFAHKDDKSYSYYFSTWADPDSLVFYPDDNPSSRITIDCSNYTNVTESDFPLTIQAFGKPYVIEKYAMEKNAKGNLDIIAVGKGLNKSITIDDRGYYPIRCAFISNGQEYECRNFGVSDSDVISFINYHFDIWVFPDTIIFYQSDNAGERVKISCK